jgi:hypothetical protein
MTTIGVWFAGSRIALVRLKGTRAPDERRADTP